MCAFITYYIIVLYQIVYVIILYTCYVCIALIHHIFILYIMNCITILYVSAVEAYIGITIRGRRSFWVTDRSLVSTSEYYPPIYDGSLDNGNSTKKWHMHPSGQIHLDENNNMNFVCQFPCEKCKFQFYNNFNFCNAM